jgi:hypothetical protein
MIKIYKSAALVSTATGYDLHVMERSEYGDVRARTRTFPSAASMRRFYKLSGGWSNYASERTVPYRRYCRLFLTREDS